MNPPLSHAIDMQEFDYTLVAGCTTCGEGIPSTKAPSYYDVITPHVYQPKKECIRPKSPIVGKQLSAVLSDGDLDIYTGFSTELEYPSKELEKAFSDTISYVPLDLISAIEAEPIEDGFCHPAEQVLRLSISENKPALVEWLHTIISGGSSPLSANLLRCVGRLQAKEVAGWGIALASKALQQVDLEVRDAAVQALELWGTPDSIKLLKTHQEKVPWLNEYINRVVKELSIH